MVIGRTALSSARTSQDLKRERWFNSNLEKDGDGSVDMNYGL